jgi:hypothetical protein
VYALLRVANFEVSYNIARVYEIMGKSGSVTGLALIVYASQVAVRQNQFGAIWRHGAKLIKCAKMRSGAA